MAYETNAKNSQDLGRPTSCVHVINKIEFFNLFALFVQNWTNRSDKIECFGQIKQKTIKDKMDKMDNLDKVTRKCRAKD